MTKKSVLVPLAQGFEEIEAVTIVDVLRRAEIRVVTAGLTPGKVTGAHGITVVPDQDISEARAEGHDMIVLPGGLPGSQHLHDDARVQALLAEFKAKGLWTAAICAAPMALVPSGIAEGKRVTSYPGFESKLVGAIYREEAVVVDGRVVTSRGPGTALRFALKLVELLDSPATAAKLGAGMLATA